MKKTTLLFLSLALILGISSCKEDETPKLGEAPTEADAAFTYAPTAANANIIDFTATNAGFTYSWDFDNGTNAATKEATAEYPNKGTYTVTLTVLNSGGSASSSQDIIIADDDASLLNNPLYTLLTGGTAGGGSKTWVIDSTRQAHLGVGPVGGTWPEWWDASPGDKANSGLYSDKYTFTLQGFKFDQITNGSVFVKTGSQGQFPGSYENSDDWSAPFADQLGETWTIIEGDEDTTISISGEAFLGMYTGVREYKIVTLSENELTIRYVDVADATTAWYLRLVPVDFPVDGGGGGGEPVNTSTLALPFDFETESLDMDQWEAFGGSTIEIIDNPNSGGINTSNKVVQTIHGDQTWAGIAVTLKDPLDLTSGNGRISVKVFAPAIGEFRIKIEDFKTGEIIIEKDVAVTKANEWEEISIDFSEAAAGIYNKVAFFPGWGVANSGTFLVDDISQK
ncbi:MAG: PKD repeat protein [Bacteroidia bacterium]|jgi:PKD repeat protein